MRKLITADEFRAAARDKKLSNEGVLRTFADGVEKSADGSRVLSFTISTEDVDRMGDIISLDGWDLENYQANPVVLWAHQSRDLPIAKAIKIWKHSKKLKASADFVDADMPVVGPLADAVFQMYSKGFLNATSVGMLPKKWAWSEDPARPYGIDFSEHELLEFSAVPIPANPKALLGGKSAGIEISPLIDWAKAITGLDGDNAVNLQAVKAAAAYRDREIQLLQLL